MSTPMAFRARRHAIAVDLAGFCLAVIADRAADFASLVAAAGFSACVILRADNAEAGVPPYIEITNEYAPRLHGADALLATTETAA